MDYAAEEAPNLSGKMVSKTNYTFESFSGGPDHVGFSDPTVGIPCCMLGQWPDLNYHTATDTLDVIDPEVLAFSCRTAALFVYTLANLKENHIREIQNKAHVNLSKRLAETAQHVLDGKLKAEQISHQLRHIKQYFTQSAEDYKRVYDIEDELIEKEKQWISNAVGQMMNYLDVEETELKVQDDRVFERTYVGPINSLVDCVTRYPQSKHLYETYQQKMKTMGMGAHTLETLMQFYLNGKRTVSEIAQCVQCDTLMECHDAVGAFVELLEGVGLAVQKQDSDEIIS